LDTEWFLALPFYFIFADENFLSRGECKTAKSLLGVILSTFWLNVALKRKQHTDGRIYVKFENFASIAQLLTYSWALVAKLAHRLQVIIIRNCLEARCVAKTGNVVATTVLARL